MTPVEIINKARTDCLGAVRASGRYIDTARAMDVAEKTVVRALRGKPVTRAGGVVRFARADSQSALAEARSRVARFLAA